MLGLLREFSLPFFSLIEIEISEQAGRQVATEGPNKGFLKRPGALIYVIIT